MSNHEWESNIEKYNKIHPTAIIHPTAVLGVNNHVGPFCMIGPGVMIGNNNRFESHCVIGAPPEHRDHLTKYGEVIIGNNNTFRSYVTVDSGTPGLVTTLADNCLMLRGSHLGHDVILDDDVTISCNVLVGGHTFIMKGANLGLGAIIHQHQTIGAYAMIGMGAVVSKKVGIWPGHIYVGVPAVEVGKNSVGLERAKVDDVQLKQLTIKWQDLIHRGKKS